MPIWWRKWRKGEKAGWEKGPQWVGVHCQHVLCQDDVFPVSQVGRVTSSKASAALLILWMAIWFIVLHRRFWEQNMSLLIIIQTKGIRWETIKQTTMYGSLTASMTWPVFIIAHFVPSAFFDQTYGQASVLPIGLNSAYPQAWASTAKLNLPTYRLSWELAGRARCYFCHFCSSFPLICPASPYLFLTVSP